jgi:hypothetical protein
VKKLKDHLVYRREFINKPGFESVAFVHTELLKGSNDGSCTIGDCGRTISLSIEMYSKEHKANTLFKLNKLIDALTELRDALATVKAR